LLLERAQWVAEELLFSRPRGDGDRLREDRAAEVVALLAGAGSVRRGHVPTVDGHDERAVETAPFTCEGGRSRQKRLDRLRGAERAVPLV
jgi:hypothetical protein